jgi:LysR family transcriptional regulator, glycine cleavage system transcriptional activator
MSRRTRSLLSRRVRTRGDNAASTVESEDSARAPERAGLSSEQRNALPPFGALCAFEAIGTHGGIRRAALALSRDHAAVSRHIRALEKWASVPLLNRGGELTPHGAKFHRQISGALKTIAAASFELTHRGADRRLRLWCVPGFAVQWIAPRLGAFSSAYPDIDLELQPTDAMPNLSTHEADAVVRYVPDVAARKGFDPDLTCVDIARPAIMAVASPKFIAKLKHPIAGPVDLVGAPLLHEASFDQWRRWFSAQGIDTGESLSGPRLWHGHLTVAAAKRGQGVALSNVFLIGDELRNGALVEVARNKSVHLGTYVFIARQDRWRDRSVHHFRRWLEQSVSWAASVKSR